MSVTISPMQVKKTCQDIGLAGSPCIVYENVIQEVAEVTVPFMSLVCQAVGDDPPGQDNGDGSTLQQDTVKDSQIVFIDEFNCWALQVNETDLYTIEDCCAYEGTFLATSPTPVRDKLINCGHIKISVSIVLARTAGAHFNRLKEFPVFLQAPFQNILEVPGARAGDLVCEELQEVLGCRFCCVLQTIPYKYLIDEPMVTFKVPMLVQKKVLRIPQQPLPPCKPEKKIKPPIPRKSFRVGIDC